MASEYYKWLARDVRPEEKKELTREEKWKNWWYYHKAYVIIGIICVLLIGNTIWQTIHNARTAPDYTIAYVGSVPLSGDTTEALQTTVARLGEDLSGDGQVLLALKEYLLSPEGASDEVSAQHEYTTAMQLTMDIETAGSMIFLLEDPEAFCETYPILVPSQPDGPLYFQWDDCPALPIPQSGVPELAIACRGLWKGESSDAIDAAIRLFDLLTEGAAPEH